MTSVEMSLLKTEQFGVREEPGGYSLDNIQMGFNLVWLNLQFHFEFKALANFVSEITEETKLTNDSNE